MSIESVKTSSINKLPKAIALLLIELLSGTKTGSKRQSKWKPLKSNYPPKITKAHLFNYATINSKGAFFSLSDTLFLLGRR